MRSWVEVVVDERQAGSWRFDLENDASLTHFQTTRSTRICHAIYSVMQATLLAPSNSLAELINHCCDTKTRTEMQVEHGPASCSSQGLEETQWTLTLLHALPTERWKLIRTDLYLLSWTF